MPASHARKSRRLALRRFALALLAVFCTTLIAPGLPHAAAADPADYSASVTTTRLTGTVGEQTTVTMTLDPPVAPAGYFVTTLLTVRTAPDGPAPAILPGFPDATVTPSAPGRLELDLLVNLVTKSSCGGVEATTILETPITIDVAPMQ